jgi:hypothetical protein
MVNSGTPPGVPASFDCAIRSAAWEYGKKLMPARGSFRSLYDALQLGACSDDAAGQHTPHDVWMPPTDPLPTDQSVLYVNPMGTAVHSDLTFGTVHEAVEASRKLRERHGQAMTIALRAGVHYLPATLNLGPADSGLTLRSYPGETAMWAALILTLATCRLARLDPTH